MKLLILTLAIAAVAAVLSRRAAPAAGIGTHPRTLADARAHGHDLAIFAAG